MDIRPPVMDTLLSSPPTEQTCDIAMAIAAIDRKRSRGGNQPSAMTQQDLHRVTSTRRVLAIAALGGLFIAGVTVLTSSGHTPSVMAAHTPNASGVFTNARAGDCLSWPNNAPGQARRVDCKEQHLFEVAEPVAMQTSQQPCQLAVQRYLGTRYDPSGKFTVSVLWSDEGSVSGAGQLLCGLQLAGTQNQPVAFAGKIADLDQSKVWPAGTCLGIESASNQLTDVPVDCGATHGQEVAGSVNLADRFSGTPPAVADQDAFIREACTRTVDGYLAPVLLRDTGLTLVYNTTSSQSWLAGSRQVSCGMSAPMGDRGWAPLIGSAKGRLSINGAAPVDVPPPPPVPPAAPPTTTDATMLAVSEPQTRPPRGATVTASPTPAASPSPAPMAVPVAAPAPAGAPVPAAPPAPGAPAPAAPPGPPAPAAPPEPPAPVGQVIEIPGLPPITLPVFPPPPPPPPAG